MTKKLRYKFIGFASGAVALLLLLILGAINIVNFSLVASSSDQITANLAQNGGVFNDPENRSGPFTPGQQGTPAQTALSDSGRPDSPDMQASMRYFTVSYDSAGTGTLLQTRFQAFDSATALTYANDVHARGYGTGWYAKNFRYRVYSYNGQDYVSFIDASRELSPSYNVLYASIGGGLGGLLLSFLVLIPISKILVKPTEEAWRKQKRFVSDASHELKTPLSIISANNEISELTHGETEQSKAIAKQVKTMNRLVKSLNALAKLEEGQSIGKISEFDLSLAVSEIFEGFEAKANGQFAIQKEIADNLIYKGDETMIRSLYQTIIENAFKYGKSQISISLQKEGDRIVTLLSNDADVGEDGPLDRVFERFYRSDEARASSVEGSGIGLSLAKEIVSHEKGRIFAKAENGNFVLKIEF